MRTLHRPLALLAVVALLSVVALARADNTGSPQIVGGQNVPDPNPYTYQVSIGTSNSYFCGGSIIAADWVLSAAHCFVNSNTGAVTDKATLIVRVGIRNIQDGFGNAVAERTVAQLVVHPSYDRTTSANDIALLQLTAVADSAWIVPLADAANDATLTAPGTTATATGWGAVEQYEPGTDPPGQTPAPDILQFVQMPIADNATCQISSSQLCAGVPQGGVDTCQGDSGGPLVVDNGSGGYIQVGVVSFGAGCAWPGNYGVYTRVSSYIDWMATTMNVTPPTFTSWLYLPVLVR